MECGTSVTIKQEAVECDVVVKCEAVKEETGPEQHEWSSACARVEEEAGGRTECGVSAAAARAGLYAGHEVKGELVLGPTALQPPDALIAPPSAVSWEVAAWAGLGVHANSAILSTSAKRQTKQDIKPQDPPASELYSCDACGEQFARKRSLIRHIRLHSSDSHAQAPAGSVPNVVPDERRSAPAALAAAVRARIGDKPRQCPLCPKQFSSKTILVRHERIHTGEKPYKCDICQKQFTYKRNLVYHVKSHTGSKPYKCDICQKQFIQKHHLVDHVRSHTGKKQHKCDVCQKQFTRKSNVVRHVKSHTGENPHKCDICLKHFAQKISLIRHLRIHTGEKPYNCDICQQHFTQKSSLIRHIKRKKGKNHTSVIIVRNSFHNTN